MIVLQKWQGIKQMEPSSTLAYYKTNNYSETPKCHQNLDTSHQKIIKY